jgi:hypothetical protein
LIEKAPFLEISMVDGHALPHKNALKINAMGLIDTRRD